jgi:hypothetical protein
LSLDASGDVYATGSFQGTATILGSTFTAQTSTSASGTNAFLIKLGPSGTAPSVSVDAAAGQALTSGNSPINFTVAFSSPVVNFVASDVTLSGTATGAAVTGVSATGPTTYNVAVSGMSGLGTVIATVAAGVVQDPYGDYNAVSTSPGGDNSVTFTSFFAVTAPASGTFVAGQIATIQWSTANLVAGHSTTVSLGYDADVTSFGANEHWIEIGGVTAANGTAVYSWNTTGVAAGTYYLGGYLYDANTAKAIFSSISTPIVIQDVEGIPVVTTG